MSDKQPLLDSSSKVCDEDAAASERNRSDPVVNVFQLFRFADRIELMVMFVALCFIVLDVLCNLSILILFGQLTGLFAAESFVVTCGFQVPDLVDTVKNNITCPLGIVLNSFNFARLYKLCDNNDVIVSSTLSIATLAFREKALKIIYWLMIIGFFEFFTISIATLLWTISIRRQVYRMNILLFRSLIQRNILYFDTISTSQLNAKLFTSIETIETGIGLEFRLLVFVILCIVGSLITSFIIDWHLALVMLCIIPFVIGGSLAFGKTMTNETTKQFKTYSKVGEIIEEVFGSLRTVHSLNGSKYEQTRYEKELYHVRWSGVRKGIVLGVFIGFLSLPKYIVYSTGFIFGSFLMLHEGHKLTISDILVVVSVLALCLKFLASTGPFLESLSEARAAAAPVFRLIDEAQNTDINEPDLWTEDEVADVESSSAINGDIEFANVNFHYPSRREVSVLRNLSIIGRAGQTTALVGSSGCGKSTCISLLLRQYEPSSGRIKINDQSITSYNLRHLRQHIGVVSQEPVLFNMSIYENIRFGKVNATRAEIEEAARQANAHNFIMQLPQKYETLVGERGIQLSGGEKQRIALARALVKQPSILLLDEATSALDNFNEKLVQEALDQACRNRTTIVIAHRLTTIRHAHQIYVLDNGSVSEEGTHETLMSIEGGIYQTMVKRQQMERRHNDEDIIMNKEQAGEEEGKCSFGRTRLLADSEAVNVNSIQESSTSSKQKSVFLRLLSMNSPEWIILLCGCTVCVMNGVAQTVFAFLLAKIISGFEDCSHAENHPQVLVYSVLVLLLGLLSLIFRLLQYAAFSIAGSKLTQRIRLKAFACLLRQEMAFFDRAENSSGAIGVRLSSDATALEQMVGSRLGIICEPLALCCSGFVFGIFFSWQITMIVFLAFLLTGILGFVKVKINVHLTKQSALMVRRANTSAVELLQNIRTIKQLSVEKEVLRQYSELIHQAIKMSWKPNILSAIVFGMVWGMDGYILALLYWRALVLYEKKELSPENILMIFSFAIFATQSLKVIGALSKRIGSSLSAAQNFFDLFDRTPIIDNASTNGQELVNFRGEIEFDHVKFAYPTRPKSLVLNKPQLIVKSGQRVALVGTSGCGKSTIIQLLERFYDVTEGQLLLDGVDIRRLNILWVRSRLGLVSQEPVLFNLTIAENIMYGLENISIEEIIDAATKANIHQFIERLPEGYETKVGVKGCFLSGGEKQRIAIARVLVRRPKILLLDEATSALDPYNEQIVQQALEQAQTEDPTRTSLIIAHRLSTIRSCDLICVLDGGHIAESGTHTELIQQRGIYHKMLTQHSSQRQ